MVLAELVRGDAGYDFLLWLHILLAIVGFGSTFVWPFLAAKSRQLGDPKVGYYVSQMAFDGGKILSGPFIYGVGITGVLILLVGPWEMSEAWVSIAFAVYLVALGVSLGLHLPNLKAMLGLQEQLATMDGPPPGAAAGPPPQVVELQERGKKAQMYGGILHLLFVLLLLDMVFKPGA